MKLVAKRKPIPTVEDRDRWLLAQTDTVDNGYAPDPAFERADDPYDGYTADDREDEDDE